MGTSFRAFEHVFVINRPADADRLSRVGGRLGRFGLNFERFDALPPAPDAVTLGNITPGMAAAASSHRAVLSLIHERGIEQAIVFEDDAVLRDDAMDWLERIVPQLNATAWDVFYLGLHLVRDGGMITENLGRVAHGHHLLSIIA